MGITCKHCGGAHPVWECKRPVTKSTATKVGTASNQRGSQVAQAVEQGDASVIAQDLSCASSTLALPVDTNPVVGSDGFSPFTSKPASCTAPDRRAGDKDDQPIPKHKVGRPKFITDLKAYKAMKQKEYRKKWKERRNDTNRG